MPINELAPRYVSNWGGLGAQQITNSPEGFYVNDPNDPRFGTGGFRAGQVVFATNPTSVGAEIKPYVFKSGQLTPIDLSTSETYKKYEAARDALRQYKTEGVVDSAWIKSNFSKRDIERGLGKVESPEFEAQLQNKLSSAFTSLKQDIGGSSGVAEVMPNVISTFNAFAERAGFRGISDKPVKQDAVQNLLSQPDIAPPLDAANSFVQRAQGTIPAQQWSGGRYIGSDPTAVENLTPEQRAAMGAREGVPVAQGAAAGSAPLPLGSSMVGGNAGVASSAIPDINSMKSRLQTAGIDISGLTDEQINVLGAMNQVVEQNADKNKTIVPPTLSSGDMDAFLKQAQTELDPYYAEQLKFGAADLVQAMGVMSGEWTQQQAEQQKQFQEQQKQQAEQYAAAGLARSGLREEAEQKLKEQQQGLVTSQRRQVGSQLYGAGSQFERQFGTAGLQAAGGTPTLKDMYGNQIGYAPMGNVLGEQPKTKLVAQQHRQSELAQGAQALRFGNITGNYPA